jgi:tRNA(His) 5'-end guanylyltransferase
MRPPLLPEQISAFEVFADRPLAIGKPLVAHLAGRRFEERLDEDRYTRPFDRAFQKALLKTLAHLAGTLGCSFGYADRTDLLLFATSQGSDARRLMSRLAGEASAKLSLLISDVVTFDARLFEPPTVELAREYFRARRERAEAWALERYAAHVLAQTVADPRAIPTILEGLNPEEKIELLRQHSVDYPEIAAWQRYGAAVYLATDAGTGPRLVIDLDLPDEPYYPEYLARYML